MHRPAQQAERDAQHDGGKQIVDEVITEIGTDFLTKNLVRMDGEQPLQRQENDGQRDQPDAEVRNFNQHLGILMVHVS